MRSYLRLSALIGVLFSANIRENIMWNKKKWSDSLRFRKSAPCVYGCAAGYIADGSTMGYPQSTEEEIRGNKWVWRAVVFINFIGPIAYFIVGRSPRGGMRILLTDEESG